MKKYVKPELFYEHFELSQHIADCAWELQQGSKEACYAIGDTDKQPYGPDVPLFDANHCNMMSGALEEFCYPGGKPMTNTFIS